MRLYYGDIKTLHLSKPYSFHDNVSTNSLFWQKRLPIILITRDCCITIKNDILIITCIPVWEHLGYVEFDFNGVGFIALSNQNQVPKETPYIQMAQKIPFKIIVLDKIMTILK